MGQLVDAGIIVYVEMGAGEGVGFSDDEYLKNNAIMQTAVTSHKRVAALNMSLKKDQKINLIDPFEAS